MPYQKISFTSSDGVTDDDMNHIQTQYDEAMADSGAALNAHKTAATLDHPDGSVSTSKIANNAVTEAKIANSAVTSNKLASGAVTAGKLADGAVDTLSRIASGVRTSPGGTEPNRLLVGDDKGWAGGAHPWAIVPGDTVLISLPNEVSTDQGSGVVKTVRAPFIARFRVKGQYRSTTGGRPRVRVRVGGADGEVVAESEGTNSTQWQAFSVDMSSSASAFQEISIVFQALGGLGLHGALRNVTFCGTYEPADFEAIDF